MPAFWKAAPVSGMSVVLTPPTSATRTPAAAMATSAEWTATSDDEHAVSTATDGPRRPNVNDSRPAATLTALAAEADYNRQGLAPIYDSAAIVVIVLAARSAPIAVLVAVALAAREAPAAARLRALDGGTLQARFRSFPPPFFGPGGAPPFCSFSAENFSLNVRALSFAPHFLLLLRS